MSTVGLHLWEVDYPYYMTEGCFFETGCHHQVESFQAFLDEMGDMDEDMNLLFRWDWKRPDPDDEAEGDRLFMYFILQRKGYPISFEMPISEADEPAVLKYLTPKARHIARLWEPIWQAGAS